ncbi:MAG: hypothetical protein KF798_06005 [Candidatus Paracaedibacteraceae bacterium]|nr:hypothetical protein [Candidatus Paracaedibacteraceae bacterium]
MFQTNTKKLLPPFFLGCLLSTTLVQAHDSLDSEIKSNTPFPLQELPIELQIKVANYLDKSALDTLAESSKYGRTLALTSNRDELQLNITGDVHPEALQRASVIKFDLPNDNLIQAIKHLLTNNMPETLEHVKTLSISHGDINKDFICELLNLLDQTPLPNIENIYIQTSNNVPRYCTVNGVAQGVKFQQITFYYDDEDDGSKSLTCYCTNLTDANRLGLIQSSFIKRVTDLSIFEDISLPTITELENLDLPLLKVLNVPGDIELRDVLDSRLASKQYKISTIGA